MSDLERVFPLSVERTPYVEMEARLPPLQHHALAIHLTGRCILEWMPGLRMRSARPMRGDVTLVPAGSEGLLRMRGGPCEVLKIGVPDAVLRAFAQEQEEAAGGKSVLSPLLDRFAITDPLVQQIGLALLHESERPGTVDTLYRDALSRALVAHLLRRHGEHSTAPAHARRVYALSEGRARRVIDFMEANANRPFGIVELARELDLSASHFTAQFRATFGRTPARYLTWLRLERARGLLGSGNLGVGEIAALTGFAGVSHFSQAFRLTFGLTPAQYRRERGR